MGKLLGYVRVSTPRQAKESDSVANQISLLRQFCEHKGLGGIDESNIYIDAAVTSRKPLIKRAGGRLMLSALENGDTIVTTDLSRMFRNTKEFLHYYEIWPTDDVRVIAKSFGAMEMVWDTQNPMTKLFLTMIAAFHEFERTQRTVELRERVRIAKEQSLRNGHVTNHCMTWAPIGYKFVTSQQGMRIKLEPDFEAMPIICLIGLIRYLYFTKDQTIRILRKAGLMNSRVLWKKNMVAKMKNGDSKFEPKPMTFDWNHTAIDKATAFCNDYPADTVVDLANKLISNNIAIADAINYRRPRNSTPYKKCVVWDTRVNRFVQTEPIPNNRLVRTNRRYKPMETIHHYTRHIPKSPNEPYRVPKE